VKEATMHRSWICFVIVVVLAAVLAGRLTSARATDTGCRKWEIKLCPMKPEHENALRASRAAGPFAIDEGWEPFGMAYTAVAARRCAP